MSLPVPALRGTERGICFMDNGLVEKMLNKSGKEKILIVLLIGVLLLVIAIPVKSDKTGGQDMYRTVIHTKLLTKKYRIMMYIWNSV